MISRRVWLAFAILMAQPVRAQSDSARIAVLEAKVDTLMRVIGEFRVRPDVTVPCIELPNGECPVLYRQRQLGLAADAAYNGTLPGFQAQLSGIASRLSVVEGSGSGTPFSSVMVRGGDLIVPGKILIGDCGVEYPQLFQICGQGNADIRLAANLNGQNNQGSARHEHLIGAQADGGIRIEFNWICKNGEIPTKDNGACWIESTKPRRILGFDSQGTLSFSDDAYPRIDPSQTWIMLIDRANKFANWQLMKGGWQWQLGTSSVDNNFDKQYLVPKQ